MQGHHRDRALVVDDLVGIADESDLLQEATDPALGIVAGIGARHPDELLEVLDAPLRLDGLLRLQLGDVRR